GAHAAIDDDRGVGAEVADVHEAAAAGLAPEGEGGLIGAVIGPGKKDPRAGDHGGGEPAGRGGSRRGKEEGMVLAVVDAGTNDLPGVVDILCLVEGPARPGSEQAGQV